MTALLGWRAYYPDGETRDSAELEPSGIPGGVVCIVEFGETPYREIVHGGDWYVREDGRWHSTGTGDWGTWRSRPEGVAVRSCERLPHEEFDRIMSRAMADHEWP